MLEIIFKMILLFIIPYLSFATINCERVKTYNFLFVPANVTRTPDFEALVRTTTLVDKTKMISDFFTQAPQYNYITAPRKFGKSMNLDMIRRFAEMEVNKTTFELNLIKNTTKNYQIFVTIPHRTLHISQEQEIINEHMAEYPVIYVSFSNISGVYFDDMIKQMNERIYEAYYAYDWLFKTHKYMKIKTNWDKELMVEKIYNRDASESDIAVSLYYLSEILHHVFKRKVILLVDDFDTPIITALNKLEVNADRVIEFMNRIIDEFRPLAGKHSGPFIHLAYAIFSGRSVIARAPQSRLVGLALKHWRFLDDHLFTRYYGLTVPECLELLDYHHVFNEEERPMVEDFYYGYVSQGNITRIYNTYSIINYLFEREAHYPNVENAMRNYWAESDCIIPNFHKILDSFKNIRRRFLDVLVRKKVYFELTLNVTVEEVEKIPLIIKTREDITDHREDLFFSYLFESGYFTFTGTPNYFAIPNREIESELEKDFIKYFKERNHLDLDSIADSLDFILKNQDTPKDVVDKFELNLNNLLESAFKPIAGRRFVLQEFDIPALIYLAAKLRKYEYVTGEEDIIRLTGRLGVYKTESNILISGENKIALIIEIRTKQSPSEAKDVVERYRPMNIRPKTLKLMGINIESVNRTTVDMVKVIYL